MNYPLIAVAAAWLLILVLLLLDLTGLRRRGRSLHWQASGLLLALGGVIVSGFAGDRRWPLSRLHEVRLVTFPLIVGGVALLCAGVLAQARARSS